VTKEGGIAGPRVLEHMVDAVLYFEGDAGSRFRVLRAFKNRFGAVNELGVFAMGDKGPARSAESVGDLPVRRQHAAARQLRDGDPRRHAAVAGGSAGAGRCLAAVQSAPRGGGPGRNRLAMLLAVLHRHGGVMVGDQDVFVNVVGGIRVQETAADLPVLLAVLSSLRDKPLAGEDHRLRRSRPVRRDPPHAQWRGALREAATHGFKRAIVPKGNAPKSGTFKGMEVIAVERLSEALEAADQCPPPAGAPPSLAANGGLAIHTKAITHRKMIPSRWKNLVEGDLRRLVGDHPFQQCRAPLEVAAAQLHDGLQRRWILRRNLFGQMCVMHGAALGPGIRGQ
jgi:DNA repair protein RadA/Sms